MERVEEILEYELIDICIDLSNYEEGKETTSYSACDVTEGEEPALEIKCDADGIPMGDTKQEVEIRRKIIYDYIQQWRANHEDCRVFNESICAFIRINQVFLLESIFHSVGNYKSTKAVLRMEEVMAKAEFIGESQKKESDSNQKSFEKMIVMIYRSEELGNVKMTVGVKKFTHEKIEYSITVPSSHTPFLDKGMKIKDKSKKRKKRSK